MSAEDSHEQFFSIESEPESTQAIMTYAMKVTAHTTYEVARSSTVEFLKSQFCFDDEYAATIVDRYTDEGKFPSEVSYLINRDDARDRLRIFLYQELLPYYELVQTDQALSSGEVTDEDESDVWSAWAVAAVADRTRSRHKREVCQPSPLDESNQCSIGLCPLKTVTSDINNRLKRYELEDPLLGLSGQMVNEGELNYFEDEKSAISRRIHLANIHRLVPYNTVVPMKTSIDVAYDAMYRRLSSAYEDAQEGKL